MVRSPSFRVVVERDVDITPWVNSVTVVEDDKQADNCSIAISDPRMIYTDGLFEGSVAEIDLGYADPSQHALMLRATITKVELSYPEGGVPLLTLKGEDESIMMGIEEKKKVWKDRTVSSVAQEIGQEYFSNVQVSLDPDPQLEKPLNQDGKTDLAFLQDLARAYHAKCFVELDENDEEVFYFIPERRIVTTRRADTIVLRYRTGPTSNLTSFTPSFDSSYLDRLKEVEDVDQNGSQVESQEQPPSEIVIWSLDERRLAQASPTDKTKIRTLYDRGSERKRSLQERLAARRPAVGEVAANQSDIEGRNDTLESRQLGMTAQGSSMGNIWLRAKSRVTVEGVSERFAGDWYVSNVTHKVDGSGYRTEFKCVR